MTERHILLKLIIIDECEEECSKKHFLLTCILVTALCAVVSVTATISIPAMKKFVFTLVRFVVRRKLALFYGLAYIHIIYV